MKTMPALSPKAAIQKALCFLGSFDVERYRQLKWGYAKAIITGRGVSVIVPSIVVVFTLAMWGPAIFGSVAETVLLATMLPIAFFVIDYVLIAHSYSGAKVPWALKMIRVLMVLLSVALSTFVVTGANSGALLPEIEAGVRQEPRFQARLQQLADEEKAAAHSLTSSQAELQGAEEASRRVLTLTTQQRAEESGATLSDGVQRVVGHGTKAKGFELEIQEASTIAAGAQQAKGRVEQAATRVADLKKERQQLDAEIAQEVKKRQGPGAMISALYGKFMDGNPDVLFSAGLFLLILVVIDCSALILSHVPTPASLVRIAQRQSEIDVARAEMSLDHELQQINSQRPPLEIKVSGVRGLGAARVVNMRQEGPEGQAADETRRSA